VNLCLKPREKWAAKGVDTQPDQRRQRRRSVYCQVTRPPNHTVPGVEQACDGEKSWNGIPKERAAVSDRSWQLGGLALKRRELSSMPSNVPMLPTPSAARASQHGPMGKETELVVDAS